MSNAGADIFLILLRPTKVPVAGEAVSHLFQGQVLIESLSWTLTNADEVKHAESRRDDFSKYEDLIRRSGSAELREKHAWQDAERDQKKALDEFVKERAKIDPSDRDALRQADQRFSREMKSINERHRDKMDDIRGVERAETAEDLEAKARQDAIDEAERNRNFEFKFTKRVDIASTQMLNSMKSGDIFPSGTLTIHKRSATVADGTSLVFNIQKIRLLEYRLQVAVTDTMTEMMEEWTCEFGALAYVYKNPPAHYSSGNAGQAAAKTLSQGTARAFTMKTIGSPL
jgi:type VI protein secretion system component Hcp